MFHKKKKELLQTKNADKGILPLIRLKMLCDPTMIPDTALYLSRVAECYGVAERRAHRACFVVETILEVRMEEADKKDPYLFLELKKDVDKVLISVADKGTPYVLTEYQKRILRKGLVDNFFFEQLGVKGQRITVGYKLDVENGTAAIPFIVEKEEEWQNTDFTCRPTIDQDEDIVNAIQCIYTSYGYNYIHQELYDVDIFRNMLQSGRYISVLAENEFHQVAGHVAIEEHNWFPGIMEVCNLVVKPSVRGKNISDSLVRAIVSLGKERNLSGIYSMPAMFHPISQRLATQNGFYPCGMYFYLLGASVAGEYGDGSSRLSAAFSVHIYEVDKVHLLYPPEECAVFVENVFEQEKMNYASKAGDIDPSATTSLSYNYETLSRRLEIKIDQAGSDMEEVLKDLLTREESEMVEVIMVYMNVNDPGCPACYRFLRECGLIFTGCLPGSRTHDYLLMQHLRGQTLDKSRLVAEPDYQEMLDRLYEINGM
jgi:hypothetical protein